MKASIIGVFILLVAAVLAQPVTKTEEAPAKASKRTTVLTEVESIPDSESDASETKEKRGAARLTPISSNSLTAERPGQSNQHQSHQLSEIAQLTQVSPQSPSQIFAPHPYSFVLPYPAQPKIAYSSPKSPYIIPQQQQQFLQLPSFGQQHQQYMLILPPQHAAAQHQVLMLIAPPPTATGFHYLTQPPAAQTGIPPQHLINFYAGQPQHQSQGPIQQREQTIYQPIPQPSSQHFHIPSQQVLQQQMQEQNTRTLYPQQQQNTRTLYPQEQQQQNTRPLYSQDQPHVTYQTIPQEQQSLGSSQQSLKQSGQQQQQQQQFQQQFQQQYLLEESLPTPASLVSSYGSRLQPQQQPSHHNQQQYKTIIKV